MIKNINIEGCHWIRKRVNYALAEGQKEIDLSQAMAYAEDAEYQMSLGNPPCFEVMSWHTSSGHVEEFEVPEKYIEEVRPQPKRLLIATLKEARIDILWSLDDPEAAFDHLDKAVVLIDSVIFSLTQVEEAS